jgi:hypothetical protein
LEALRAGYFVHGIVLNSAEETQLRSSRALQTQLEHVKFSIVESIIKDGAYNDVIHGASYVIHVASPVSAVSS